MVASGITPQLVAILGDWQSDECFQKFYLRVQATKAISECLLPPEYRFRAAAASAESNMCLSAC